MRHQRTLVAALVLGLSLLTSPPVRAQDQCVELPTGTATINGSVKTQESDTAVIATVTARADIDGFIATYSGVASPFDGTFSIQVGAPATYVVSAAPLDFVHAPELYDGVLTTAAATTFSVTQGQVVNNVDFTVVIGATLSGTVTEQGSGDPLENVTVLATNLGDLPATGFAQTDASGDYTMGGLAAGQYQIMFFPDVTSVDYLVEFYNDSPSAPGNPVNVTVAGVTGIDAALAIGGRIEGTVSGPGGVVANAGVAAIPENGYAFAADTTNASGDYSLLVPAGSHKVIFGVAAAGLVGEFYNDKPDQASADTVSASSGATTANIDATLAASGQITGHVSDASSGDPIEGTTVTAYNASTDVPVAFATTNAAGNYAINSNLSTGSYKVGFDGPDQAIGGSPGYIPRFYSNKGSLGTATSVAVTAPNATANIDQELVPCGEATGSTTTTTTTGEGTTTTTVGGGAGACGDPVALTAGGESVGTGNAVSATDALFILRVSVSLDTCLPCVCDVNNASGITATDALVVLNASVGLPVPLDCPACS